MPKRSKQTRRRMPKPYTSDTFPFIHVSRIDGDPPPVANNASYSKRIVTVDFTSSLTVGAVSAALARQGDFQITECRIWGLETPTTTFSSGTFTAQTSLLLVGASVTADPVVAKDYGTANSRPSVRFRIPRNRAVVQNYDPTSASTLFNISSTANTAVAHITVWQYAS